MVVKKPLRCTVPFSQLSSEQIHNRTRTFKPSKFRSHTPRKLHNYGNFRGTLPKPNSKVVSPTKMDGKGERISGFHGKRQTAFDLKKTSAVSFRETTESIQVFHEKNRFIFVPFWGKASFWPIFFGVNTKKKRGKLHGVGKCLCVCLPWRPLLNRATKLSLSAGLPPGNLKRRRRKKGQFNMIFIQLGTIENKSNLGCSK